MQIRSADFQAGKTIPKDFTGDGADRSPALEWSGAPSGTKEFALICDDPDAPTPEPWVHWVIYGIPASAQGLKQGLPRDAELKDPAGARQGKNSWSALGYQGPAPPRGHGTHHYHFKLYALSKLLGLKAGATKGELLKALAGAILEEAEVLGTYERR